MNLEQATIIKRETETPDVLTLRLPQGENTTAIISTVPAGVDLTQVMLPGEINPPYDLPNSDEDVVTIYLENVSGVQTIPPVGTPQEFLKELKTGRYGVVDRDVEVFSSVISAAERIGQVERLTNYNLYLLFQELVAKDTTGVYGYTERDDIYRLLFGCVVTDDLRGSEKFRVKAFTIDGKYYEGDDLVKKQSELREGHDKAVLASPMSGLLVRPEEGECFYRMPTKQEWRQIRGNNGIWLVNGGTNVELAKNVEDGGSFVDAYSDDPDYASVTLRFKPSILSFNKVFSGGAVFGRSFVQQYVEVEFLDKESGEWRRF